MVARHFNVLNRQGLAGALASVVLCVPALSSAQECSVQMPRQGLQKVELFVNARNEGYLLVRFADPRFDDTTEVYRLRGCAKVASGVTAKSNYAATLRESGFNDLGEIRTGSQREIVNSYYGTVRLSADARAVTASVHETDQARLDAIAALLNLVRLKEAVPISRLRPVLNDAIVARIPAAEIGAAAEPELNDVELARSLLALDALVASTTGSALQAIITDTYRRNLENAAKAAVTARPSMRAALDAEAARRAERAGSASSAKADLRASLAKMASVGHESSAAQLNLVALVRQGGDFDEAVELFSSSRTYASTAVQKEIALAVEGAFIQIASSSQPGNPARLVRAIERLATADFSSQVVIDRSMLAIRAANSFDNILALAKPLGKLRGWDSKDPRRSELEGRVVESYVTLADRADVTNASAAREGLLALHSAGFLSDRAVNAFIGAVRARGRFSDAVAAYSATRQVQIVDELQDLARQPSERFALEQIAVDLLADKDRLVSYEFRTHDTPIQTSVKAGGFLSGKELIREAHKVIAGSLHVRLRPDRPVPLEYSSVRLTFSLSARARGMRSARGLTLQGESDIDLSGVSTTVSVVLGAGSESTSVSANLGAMEVAYLDRGVAGGYTARVAVGDGAVDVRLVRVEVRQ